MADKKLSALTVATSIAAGDYIPFTSDPGGTPASRNITLTNFEGSLGGGTTATSWKINTGGNEADIQTTGLSADRDFTLPDIDTMLAGSVLVGENAFEIIAYT
jgi:hypothetical protein